MSLSAKPFMKISSAHSSLHGNGLLRHFRLLCNLGMGQHLGIQFLLYYLSTGHVREVKHNRKFQPVSSKSGRGGLREVVAYKMFQKY